MPGHVVLSGKIMSDSMSKGQLGQEIEKMAHSAVCISNYGAYWLVYVLVAQLYLTLYHPMDCSPPGSSVHGILQARILEWVAIP